MSIRFDGKNWAIGFLVGFDVLFLALAIIFRLDSKTAELGKDLWGIFLMANGGLFLILNSAGKAQAGIDVPPGTDLSTTATTQKVEVTTTTDPTSLQEKP
jgi:hypothetical protein